MPTAPPSALDGPTIFDPYVAHSSPWAMAPRRSRLAIAALIVALLALILGPVAGAVALVLAALARPAIRAGHRRGRAFSTAATALGVVCSLVWTSVVAAWWLGPQAAGGPPLAAAPARAPEPAVLPKSERQSSMRTTRRDPRGTVPRDTSVDQIGRVPLVALGVGESSLADALRAQLGTARTAGETLLVTTTRGGCEPCDGFLSSLPDARMQDALDGVRVVVVDIDVFGSELDALHIQRDTIPGFFLMAEDISPRDAIHGGEWGADIAENIAPVLGPFVRGRYRVRKFEWRPAQGGGIWL